MLYPSTSVTGVLLRIEVTFKTLIANRKHETSQQDPFLKRTLWQIIAGTRGGANRARILETLKEMPYNANKLAEKLNLDYKTVQHHLKVLVKNGLIATSETGAYGALYFLTPRMENAKNMVDEIWAKIGRR